MNSLPHISTNDVICIDALAQADLMFWNQLSRAFAPRPGEPPLLAPAMLLVGSGERAERVVGDPLTGPVRERGSLQFPAAAADAFERSIREENKKVVFELTDAGIPAVGFVAGDRKLLVRRGATLEAGNWAIVAKSVADGVLPVVSSVASSEDGIWFDTDPVEAANALAGSGQMRGRLILMVQRLVPSLRTALETGVAVSLHALVDEGGVPGWRASMLAGNELVHHVEWLGRTGPCELA